MSDSERSQAGLVVDEEDARTRGTRSGSCGAPRARAAGQRERHRRPGRRSDRKSSVPPCSFTMPADTDSPRPGPAALAAGREERVGEAREVLGRDADPLVRHLEQTSPRAAVGARREPDRALGDRAAPGRRSATRFTTTCSMRCAFAAHRAGAPRRARARTGAVALRMVASRRRTAARATSFRSSRLEPAARPRAARSPSGPSRCA